VETYSQNSELLLLLAKKPADMRKGNSRKPNIIYSGLRFTLGTDGKEVSVRWS